MKKELLLADGRTGFYFQMLPLHHITLDEGLSFGGHIVLGPFEPKDRRTRGEDPWGVGRGLPWAEGRRSSRGFSSQKFISRHHSELTNQF